MRLVFVNDAHPDAHLVAGMRLGNFARAMALRGHQVVVLTSGPPDPNPDAPLIEQLETHDWSHPLIVSRRGTDDITHSRALPGAFRRARTLWRFLGPAGPLSDWHAATRGAAANLATHFRPDLVWGTFGNTTNLAIARDIARRCRCPWVMDIKDNWSLFVPSPLRRLLAWRFRDASGWTVNSHHHLDATLQWFRPRPAEVIYSGVSDEFFAPKDSSSPRSVHQLLLVGSVYADEHLREYLTAVGHWVAALPPEERATLGFTYIGSDAARVTAALDECPLPCGCRILPQQSVADFADVARRSFANSYLSYSSTFHHKLMELLVCGTPVVCYPAEHDESLAVAAQTHTVFAVCENDSALERTLAELWAGRLSLESKTEAPPWRWTDFAEPLERFFQRCVGQ